MSAGPQIERELRCTVGPDVAGKTRLDAWLAGAAGISRERVKKLLAGGFVRNGADGSAPAGGRVAARPGDTWIVRLPAAAPTAIRAQDIPLRVVHEDDHVLVIDKPAGLVVHPAAGHEDGTLVNALLNHCPGIFGIGGEERPGIVHRLDKDTSGLMVVAKTDAALCALARGFHEGTIRKTYLAVSCGVPDPPAGHVENLIGRSPRDRKKMAVVERCGKLASTDWSVEEDFATSALLRLRIHTGRTHQIRVHLASFGCPVAGDRLYGSGSADAVLPFRPQRQMLHAWRLALVHPADGREMTFEAPPPQDFDELLQALRERGGRCG